MGWIRLGECRRCGKCCHLKTLLQAPIHIETSVSNLEARCKHISFDENGLATCTIFDKDERPEACSLHPSSPKSLTSDECGYFFIFTDS